VRANPIKKGGKVSNAYGLQMSVAYASACLERIGLLIFHTRVIKISSCVSSRPHYRDCRRLKQICDARHFA
jgi:hypothetical protein